MYDYIYVSRRQLRDLADQLPAQTKGTIKAGLEASIPHIFKASIEGERLSNDPRLFDSVAQVEKALRRDKQIGTIGEQSDWIQGTIEMYWGSSAASIGERIEPVLFFGGVHGNDAILLGGSKKHLREVDDAALPSTSDLRDILAALAANESSDDASADPSNLRAEDVRAREALSYCLGNWSDTKQTVTFLAKRFFTREDVDFEGSKWRLTIGAPLYVRT